MGCGCDQPEEKKKATYVCEACGKEQEIEDVGECATSCCGQPMKKKQEGGSCCG